MEEVDLSIFKTVIDEYKTKEQDSFINEINDKNRMINEYVDEISIAKCKIVKMLVDDIKCNRSRYIVKRYRYVDTDTRSTAYIEVDRNKIPLFCNSLITDIHTYLDKIEGIFVRLAELYRNLTRKHDIDNIVDNRISKEEIMIKCDIEILNNGTLKLFHASHGFKYMFEITEDVIDISVV